jgi:hypothetical protein
MLKNCSSNLDQQIETEKVLMAIFEKFINTLSVRNTDWYCFGYITVRKGSGSFYRKII